MMICQLPYILLISNHRNGPETFESIEQLFSSPFYFGNIRIGKTEVQRDLTVRHHKIFQNLSQWILIIAVIVLTHEQAYTEPNISFINNVIILTPTLDYHQNSLYDTSSACKNFSGLLYLKKHCIPSWVLYKLQSYKIIRQSLYHDFERYYMQLRLVILHFRQHVFPYFSKNNSIITFSKPQANGFYILVIRVHLMF